MKFLVAVILAVSCIPNSDKKSESKALKFNSMSKYLARISKVLTKKCTKYLKPSQKHFKY